MSEACEFGVCQCCLGHNACLSMTASYQHAGVSENYAEMLMETFSFNVEGGSRDCEPLICRECVPQLRDAHAFRARLQRAQACLREQAECNYTEMIEVKCEVWERDDTEPLGAASSVGLSQGAGAVGEPPLAGGACPLPASSGPAATRNLFTCDMCLLSFEDKYQLVDHIKTHNCQNNSSVKYSNATLCQKSDLKEDSRVNIREKKHVCQNCGKAFSTSECLKVHVRIHTGEKPYVCQHCNTAFSQKNNLKTHLKTHTGEKPYNCLYCNKTFSTSGNLKTHLRTHTGEKPFMCKRCNAAFSESGTLKLHQRTHTGEKPFVCKYCNKNFSRRENLKVHLRRHTGEKPYICKHCNKAFITNCNLKRHLRTH